MNKGQERRKGMYIITGKITEEGKDVGYSVYGLNEQRSCILTKKEVRNMLINKQTVFGMSIGEHFSSTRYTFKKCKPYLWAKLPEINGKGEPEREEDKDLQVMLGSNGFKELKVFVTVNTLGEISVYDEEGLKEQIHNGNIAGAVIDKRGKVINYINFDITDQWLMNLGYRRNDDKKWYFHSKEAGAESKKAEAELKKKQAEALRKIEEEARKNLDVFLPNGGLRRYSAKA